MAIEFEVSELISATRESIYEAWLSSTGHSKMTGSPANASSVEGESFEAWDGYITGKNLELEFPRRIIQSWRTVEFDDITGQMRVWHPRESHEVAVIFPPGLSVYASGPVARGPAMRGSPGRSGGKSRSSCE